MWLDLAASQSSGEFPGEVMRLRDYAAGRMTSSQIAEAQRLAREWTPISITPSTDGPVEGFVPGAREDVRPPEVSGGTGTAFIVHPDGLLLTAHHVIDRAISITVSCNGKPGVPATIASSMPAIDLAVLTTTADLGTSSFLQLSPNRSLALGDEVFTVGYPNASLLGPDPTYGRGTVNSLSGPGGDASYLTINVPIQPGNSGGPVVNRETGDVIGIVVGTADLLAFLQATASIPQNINWAVKSVFASALFTPPSTSFPSSDDVITRVTEATCLVTATGSAQ